MNIVLKTKKLIVILCSINYQIAILYQTIIFKCLSKGAMLNSIRPRSDGNYITVMQYDNGTSRTEMCVKTLLQYSTKDVYIVNPFSVEKIRF